MAGSRYKNTQSLQAESPLLGTAVPRDVRAAKIYPTTPIDMLGMFARTCQKAEAETAFTRLLLAAVGAKPESYKQEDETSLAAVAILNRHPALLFVKGVVTDHFGRKIIASPYQLLLGAGDIWALKQVHEEIITKIDGGEAKAQEQFQQQFPNCKLPFDPEVGEAALYDDRNIAQVEQVKKNLKSVVTAISADPCTNGVATLDATKIAIAELCQLFAPKQGDVIRTGLHFPVAILQEIFSVYDAQFTPWSGAQLSFFSREVIGAVLAASTVVDGQCYKYGLKNLDAKKGPDRRDGLFCRHPKGIPEKLAPLNDKLGHTMFVDPYDGESCFLSSSPGYFDWYNENAARTLWGRGNGGGVACCLQNLCRAKNQSLQSYMPAPKTETTSEAVSVCNLLK